MISVDNLSKSYGSQVLFDGVTFRISPRERVGLVGRNGHGKTTLFRLIVGEEHADAGSIIIPKNYRIGYVRQHLEFTEPTVLKEGMKGLSEDQRSQSWKVEKILAGLGFSPDDMHRPPQEFSDGYQVRINLAKVLTSEPDLLLLDEPTNFLDITSIRWVERFLVNWPHEVMLITHDRSFMDKVATHIVGIHRQKVRKIAGNTGKYYTQLAQDEEVYEKTRLNDDRRRKEIELFITRFRAKARLANLVQSRVKTLEKMEKREKLERIESLEFAFRHKHFPGKYVLQVRDLSFSYHPELPLIENLSFYAGARERVAVIGRNGKGKTTLLKLLAGALTPHSGEIVYSQGVVKSLYEESAVQSLVDSRTIEEELFFSSDDVDRQQARNICGTMMFEGDDALKQISVLSGGEKSRVLLGKLLLKPANLLLLDEPTNHLDMESCDALLAALDSFEGAVVFVTHNEMLLHALAERLIVFKHNQVSLFEGTYERFLETGGWEDEEAGAELMSKKVIKEAPSYKRTRKGIRRRRSEIIAERSKELKPIEQRINQVEGMIDAHENELEKLNLEMQEALRTNSGNQIVELSQSTHRCQTAIDELFHELEKLTATFEARTAVFKEKLEAFEREAM